MVKLVKSKKRCVVDRMGFFTSHFALRTSHFALRTSHFVFGILFAINVNGFQKVRKFLLALLPAGYFQFLLN